MQSILDRFILMTLVCTQFSCTNETSFSIGGTATGIDGDITIQNNGKDDFIITNDVDFIFDTALKEGESYEVTVSKKPTGQTCTVTNGEGTVTKKVSNIVINCAPTAGTLTVNVTHLNGTVVLQNNAGDDLTITSNGTDTFSTEIKVGDDYDVTVLTQPTNQTCQITDGTGTMDNDGAEVSIACGKVIFISTTAFDGAFGTISVQQSGDHQCDIDAGNPDTSKSYRVLQSSLRIACTTANCSGGIGENVDWVLAPNTTYVRPDDTILFTTDSAGIFDFGGGSMLNSFAAGLQVLFWTGIENDWTSSANNCLDWTDATNAENGVVGYSDATDSSAVKGGSVPCDTADVHLLCVER